MCATHTLRTLSELNVDWVEAFDLISRSTMKQSLVDMPDEVKALPFVRLFYGTPSQFFHDDLHVTEQPDCVVDICHSWATICPRGCHALEDAARRANAVVRGEGTFFSNHSSKLGAKSRQHNVLLNRIHNVLLDRITSVGDFESTWCLQPGPNVWLRSVPPELSGGEFAAGVPCVNFSTSTRTQSTTQLKRKVLFRWQLEELGLRSVERLRHAAHNLGVLKALSSRVPSVAANFIVALEAGEATPSIQSVLSCIDNFAGVGFVVLHGKLWLPIHFMMRRRRLKATWVVDSAIHLHTIFPVLMTRKLCSGPRPGQWRLRLSSPHLQ